MRLCILIRGIWINVIIRMGRNMKATPGTQPPSHPAARLLASVRLCILIREIWIYVIIRTGCNMKEPQVPSHPFTYSQPHCLSFFASCTSKFGAV